MWSLLCVTLVTLLASRVIAVTVRTEYGNVVGQTILLNSSISVDSFWGIPFARPPVGDLRFERPEKPDGWSGDFIADTLPAACMQNPLSMMFLTHPFWTKYSEDCLTINIVAPTDKSRGPYPVMVWFHGGGYMGGSNIQYPGHFLAAHDVVIAIPNYRLGVFGFASTPDPDQTIPGNMGMFDQVLALEFVRDNIAAFGGNPNSVTIFGQSAGASSAALHMVSPVSKGLFHRAICESGTENNFWTLNYPNQKPELYIYQVASNVDCPTNNIHDMVQCLKAVNETVLRRNQNIMCTPGYFCQGFAPIVDGPGNFMPDIPLMLKEAQTADDMVPMISGICKDDGSLYTAAYIPEANDGGFSQEEFHYYLRTRFLDIWGEQLTTKQYEDVFQGMVFYYTPWPYVEDYDGNREAFNKMSTDAGFGMSWNRQAKLNAPNKDTYLYIQAFKSLNASSFIPDWMGVPHNGELAYVWGYALLLVNPDVREDTGIFYDALGWTPEDMPYSDFVQTLWSNFAKFSNPTPTPVQSPYNDTLIEWHQFRNESMNVIWLDAEVEMIDLYRQRDYAFYYDYMTYITGIPFRRTHTKPDNKPRQVESISSDVIEKAISKRLLEAAQQRYPEEYKYFMETYINEL